MVEDGIRRVSRIRSRVDLLGLHAFLFSGAAFCERVDGGIHRGNRIRADGAESHVPA